MSMHLVGPYLTTTNYRKPKTKVTEAKMKQWQEWYRERCKQNKRLGLPKETFEEFVDYLHGRGKKITKSAPRSPLELSKPFHREVPKIPSLQSDFKDLQNACAKKEPQKYTGTLIKGIATMHKSNAVPVINNEQAQEISRMRRG